MMDTLLLLALNGLIWGLIIALIALGLSIIFGLLDVINIAHGDFFMVGTVVAWFTLEYTGNFWLGFITAPLFGFILGALIQRTVIQSIRGAAALSIVATFGLSLILQESVRIVIRADAAPYPAANFRHDSAVRHRIRHLPHLCRRPVDRGARRFLLFPAVHQSRHVDARRASRP